MGEKYIYMPLHLIPESTTFSIAPFWINELSTIEAVSKALPVGWRLYVKEHQAMLGERSIEFYNKVKAIPNVRLVRFNYYQDPKPWLENCQAVVTITGTAAYEAALLGKPAYVFGNVLFGMIKGITKIENIEELPELFKQIRPIDNLHECAAYIRTVKDIGTDVNLGLIMNQAHDNLMENKELTKEFFDELTKLQLFFENGYYAICAG